jgi:hypothetical protein
MSELLLYYIAAQAIKTKEVSTWQSLREKYPSKDAIRDVLPYGSWQLPECGSYNGREVKVVKSVAAK